MSCGKREHPGGAVFTDGRRHCQNGRAGLTNTMKTTNREGRDAASSDSSLSENTRCGSTRKHLLKEALQSTRNDVMSDLLEIQCGKTENICRAGQNGATSTLAHLSSCQAAISQHSVPSRHTGRWSFTDRFRLQLLQRLILPLLSLFEFMLTINAHSSVRRES